VGVAIRRIATQYGVLPGRASGLSSTSASLANYGNPLGEARDTRHAWACGLSVRPFEEGMELLYFVGCYGSYDPRNQKVAVATARILDRAGVDFGILGTRESCCGESIRKAGDEEVFRTLARENIKTFIDNGVKRVLVASPHCYHTFKNEYSEFMVNFEVVHISQYLAELIEDGRLELDGKLDKKVTFHDPCYLGRYAKEYEPPREVLTRLRVKTAEMDQSREKGFCCGAGGGRVFLEETIGDRVNVTRTEQALATGAKTVAVGCPFCMTMVTDGTKTKNVEESVQVKDLAELVADRLKTEA
jgi:Fe-S oxidoreductase